MEKLKREKEALEVKKKDLQHQLEETRSKVKVEAEASAIAEDYGYHRGRGESAELFRELLVTLAPQAFRIEGYFKAHVKFVEDRHQA